MLSPKYALGSESAFPFDLARFLQTLKPSSLARMNARAG